MLRLLKLSLFTILLSVSPALAQSDGAYISLGYGFSSGQYKGLNKFITNYNTSRSWLDKQMPKATTLSGLSVGMGFILEFFMMDLQWTGRHKTFKASGVATATGLRGYRELKYRLNTFNTALGLGHATEALAVFGGASFDFGFNETKTRTWSEGDAKPKFESTNNSKISMASSIFLDLRVGGKIAIGVKPYYQFHFFKHDFNTEDELINSYTHVEDEELSSKPSNFGMEIKLFINFR